MEQHITIDNNRIITVPENLKRIAVQYDHNVETVTFDCPRYWDGNDLSKMTIYINYSHKSSKTPSSYLTTNVCVDEEDDTLIHFDWTISRNVTDKKGPLTFLVCAKLVDEEGNEIHHWNSERNTDMYVSEGLRGDVESFDEEHNDIVAAINSRLNNNDSLVSKINTRLITTEQFVNRMTPRYSKLDIDPTFANNPFELIKWVSQYDDPSKYWKVGDYKSLSIGLTDELEIGKYDGYDIFPITISDNNALLEVIGDHRRCILSVGCKQSFTSDMMTITVNIQTENGISLRSYTDNVPKNNAYLIVNGLRMSTYPGEPIAITTTISHKKEEYPLQIIGFNHDPVADPYAYGKHKAGMTLQLGASRNIYGDDKPSLYEHPIQGLMNSDGYFKAPNKVLKDYTEGATNWVDGGFRIALQTLFDETEIADFIVPVQKYTSKYYRSNIYWEDALLSNDKVFLPSEYEMFGKQILAPSAEGEQYEFYKDGYSKFMWTRGLLDSTSKVTRLWLRSAYANKVNELKGDSNYSCNVYMSVNSFNPLSVLYSPSYANTGDGAIAPCICF